MKLYIKQKVFSIRDKFHIKDGAGHTRYTVEGELLSFGKRLHIYDNNHHELALVRQKLLTLMPRFLIEVGGRECGQIVKRLSLFTPSYHVEGLGWEVDGKIMAHDYVIRKGHHQIAQIHKVWMSWGDSYEMDIDDGADEITAVAVVLAIDAVLDAEAEAAASASSSN